MSVKRWVRRVVIALVITVIALWALPKAWVAVSTRVPRRVTSSSRSLSVTGVYYPVDLDRVGGLELLGSSVRVTGYVMGGFYGVDRRNAVIERAIPEAAREMVETTGSWTLSQLAFEDRMSRLTFTHTPSGNGFTVWLPEGRSDPVFKVFRRPDGCELFIIAAAEWKVGPVPGYLCFLTAEPRKPQQGS